jgi:hypothetical protein
VAQKTGVRLAPVAERGFADMKSIALLVDRPDDNVNVRMGLIGVQGQSVSMLGSVLLPSKVADRRQQFVGRGSRGHGEYDLVHQLRGLAAHTRQMGNAASECIQIKLPILDQRSCRFFTYTGIQRKSVSSALILEVLEMQPDRL